MKRLGRTAALALLAAATLVWATDLERADVNDDGIVNVADVARVAGCLNRNPATVPACQAADATQDGQITAADIAFVRGFLGQQLTDTRAPQVRITLPADGAATAASPLTVRGTLDDPTATVTVNGSPATLGAGTFQASVALSPGINTVTVRAADAAGNSASQSIRVTYNASDTTPPTLAIVSPADGTAVTIAALTVSGTVDDPTAAVTVNGVAATLGAGTFQATLTLTPGLNTVTAVATDPSGNSASRTIQVTYNPPDTTPPTLAIVSPADGATVTVSPLTVSGTVDDPAATVTVNGVAVTLGAGTFQATLTLTPGLNTVTAVATDPSGNSASRTIQVTYSPPDTTPPTLAIVSPADGAEVTVAALTVSGTVDDPSAAVTVNGVAATLGAGTFQATLTLTPGLNTVTAVATDPSGNRASQSIQVAYNPADTVPPTLAITSPADGAAVTVAALTVSGTVDDPAAAVTVNGVAATLGAGTFQATLTLTPGLNTVTAVATDPSGNRASQAIQVVYSPPDTTAPTVAITDPADGSVVADATVDVEGTVDDDSATVTVNGIAATVAGGTFRAPAVPLSEGVNTVVATATDPAGNLASASIQVTRAQALTLTIESPLDGAVLGASAVTVEGQVDDPAAAVDVNGVAAQVDGSGAFVAADVPLAEGFNTLTATAVSAGGTSATARIRLRRDTTPPTVTVETPGSGAIVTSLQADVAGLVNDQSDNMTIDAEDVTVEVNGVPAMIGHRAWVIPEMLLQRGLNTLEVVATDRVGNSSRTSVQVEVRDAAGQSIRLLSGGAQQGTVGELLPEPMVVTLVDANGDPVPDTPVEFRVSRGDGSVQSPSGAGESAIVRTDENGLASAYFKLGTRAGAGNNRVVATSPGFVGTVELCFAATADGPDRISAVAGANQTGLVGAVLPVPLTAYVIDAAGNPVKDVPVTFAVTQGGGNLEGAETLTRATDNDGHARVRFALGLQEGVNNNVVSATFDGLAGAAAIFAQSGRVPEARTRLAGVVIDNQDLSLEGVTVRVEHTDRTPDPGLVAVTDGEGLFAFEDLPPGHVKLIVDGSTANRPGNWIRLTFELDLVPGMDNSLGMPIRLLPVAPNAVSVENGGPDRDIVLSMPDVPGAQAVVKAHSVTCPPGQASCVVSWTQINGERMAMPPPMGSVVMLGWTLQPTGAVFDPPVDVCIPNMDMPPGQQVEMFNWDYGLGNWATIGTATITADGSQLCSDPGFGVPSAGWGCCVPPPPPKDCVLSCDDRNECTSDSKLDPPCTCRHTPTNEGGACGNRPGANACIEGLCQGGACVGRPKDEGATCDDGLFCTEPDQCKGGSCSGEKVPDGTTQTLTFELKLDDYIAAIRQFGSIMGVLETVDVTYTQDASQQNKCCEQKQQKDVPVKKVQWGLNAKLETPKIFVPSLSFDVRAVRIGVFVKLGVAGNVNLNVERDLCPDTYCWGGGAGVSGGAEGGVAAEDAAKIVSISGSLASAIKLEGAVNCEKLSYGLSHDGLKGKISAEFLDGFIAVNYQVDLIAPGPIYAGETPLSPP